MGQTLRAGDLTDYLADLRDVPSLRAPTGRTGGVRVDQIHVSTAMKK